MKNKKLRLIIIGILILIAVITNPNQDRHKELVISKFNSKMQTSMSETDNGWKQAEHALGMLLGGVFLENLINVDNYVLFSTTKITFGKETKLIGIGVFGNVFIFSKALDAIDQITK